MYHYEEYAYSIFDKRCVGTFHILRENSFIFLHNFEENDYVLVVLPMAEILQKRCKIPTNQSIQSNNDKILK